ncbi:MAG: hypothetical protein M1821_001643 [Bathelium mastoideum]|nr:MAG: hypothetical protein M1821_001643 [Bathelium mastoideum]
MSASMTGSTSSQASTTQPSSFPSASSSPSPKPAPSGLKGGAIAGIVIGVIVGVLLIAFAILYLWRKRNVITRSSSLPDPEGKQNARDNDGDTSVHEKTARRMDKKDFAPSRPSPVSQKEGPPSTTDPMFDLLMNSNNRQESTQRFEMPSKTRKPRMLDSDSDLLAEDVELSPRRSQSRLSALSPQPTAAEFALPELRKTPDLAEEMSISLASVDDDVPHTRLTGSEEGGKEN